MSNFGQTVFSRRPFVKWALSPFLLLFVILMPLAVTEWTLRVAALLGGLDLLCLLLLVGFWAPLSLAVPAFRGAAFLVFAAYAAYLIVEFASDKPLRLAGPRSEPSPRNALLGFIIIGLPALCYAVLGRFTLREPPPPEPEPDQEGKSRTIEWPDKALLHPRSFVTQRSPSHMKKRLFIALALLLPLYIAGPIIAGSFRLGDRTGPVIYPQSFHATLYIMAHESAYAGEKPRTPIEFHLYNRPLFYGLAPRLKPAAEREALLTRFREENSPHLKLLFEENQKAESDAKR